jgi:transposase
MRAVIQALQALRGVAAVSAATIVAEVGELTRFENPRQLMGYSGLVPSEYTTGRDDVWARSPRPATPTATRRRRSRLGLSLSAPPSASRCGRAKPASIPPSREIAWRRSSACMIGIAPDR